MNMPVDGEPAARAVAHEETGHEARTLTALVGQRVLYQLTSGDADTINGLILWGNAHHAGQILAADVVAVPSVDDPHGLADLQLLLDGQGTLWVAARPECTTGAWHQGQWRRRT